MRKELERKLMRKYNFLRPQQSPEVVEDNLEIMAKSMPEEKIKDLEEVEKSIGKKGLITDKIKEDKNKYNPNIYKKSVKPIWDLMVFGLEVGDGWYDLLDETFGLIQKHLNEHPEIPFKVEQVKEKYGTLRIYFYGGDEYIEKIVEDAERKSAGICEICGNIGKVCSNGFDIELRDSGFYKIPNNSGWLKALCKTHAKKLGYVYEPEKISDSDAYKYLKNAKVEYERYLANGDWSEDYLKTIRKRLDAINEMLKYFE